MPYDCEGKDCSSSFTALAPLQSHVSRQHEPIHCEAAFLKNIGMRSCNECLKILKLGRAYDQHQRAQHEVPPVEDEAPLRTRLKYKNSTPKSRVRIHSQSTCRSPINTRSMSFPLSSSLPRKSSTTSSPKLRNEESTGVPSQLSRRHPQCALSLSSSSDSYIIDEASQLSPDLLASGEDLTNTQIETNASTQPLFDAGEEPTLVLTCVSSDVPCENTVAASNALSQVEESTLVSTCALGEVSQLSTSVETEDGHTDVHVVETLPGRPKRKRILTGRYSSYLQSQTSANISVSPPPVSIDMSPINQSPIPPFPSLPPDSPITPDASMPASSFSSPSSLSVSFDMHPPSSVSLDTNLSPASPTPDVLPSNPFEIPDIATFANHGRTHRTIPASCENRFITRVLEPVLTNYLRVSQATEDPKGSAELNFAAYRFLAIPSTNLIKRRGGKKRNRLVRQLNSQFLLSPTDPCSTPEPEPSRPGASAPHRPPHRPYLDDLDREAEDEAFWASLPTDSGLRRPAMHDMEIRRRIKRAIRLTREGHIARAVQSLMQEGLAKVDDDVLQQLRDLHPPGDSDLPLPPQVNLQVTVDIGDLTKILIHLANGAHGGVTGWTGDLLKLSVKSERCMDALACMVMDLNNGRLTGCVMDIFSSNLLTAGRKANGGIRPIGSPELLAKIAAHVSLLVTGHDALKARFQPEQLGIGAKGGSERAVHKIRALLELHGSNSIAISVDFVNAFNVRSRKRILEKLYSNPDLKGLWNYAHWKYGSPSALVVRNGTEVDIISSTQGVTQGDILAGVLYGNSIQDIYEQCTVGHDAEVVAIADDCMLVGPMEDTLAAYDQLCDLCADEEEGLVISPTKSFCLWPRNTTVPRTLTEACASRSLSLQTGSAKFVGVQVSSYDMMVGEDKEVGPWVAEKVNSQLELISLIIHPAMPAQVGQLMLRYVALPKLNYLMRTVPPHLLENPLAQFDRAILCAVQTLLNLPADLDDEAQKKLLCQSKDQDLVFES